jgi:hypothetical protein
MKGQMSLLLTDKETYPGEEKNRKSGEERTP